MKRDAVMKRIGLILMVALIGLGGCQTTSTTNAGAVGVTRKQSMSGAVSEQDIERQADRIYQEQLAQARANGLLNRDSAQTVRVRRIAARLIAQTTVFRTDAKDWKWQINVQTSKEINAFCMPGGRIMIYTALIDRLSLTDAELATVMAHEIAHALREHSREAMSRQIREQMGLGVVGTLLGLNSATSQLAGLASEVFFSLPHSREQESEADKVGLELMARAGFDPHAALSLWQKMAKAGQAGTPGFFSTHPSGDSRSRDIEALMPKVEPLYQATQKPKT